MKPVNLVEYSKFSRNSPVSICVYECEDLSLYMWCFEAEQETGELRNDSTDEILYLAGGTAEVVCSGYSSILKELMLFPVLRGVPYRISNPGSGRTVVLSYRLSNRRL